MADKKRIRFHPRSEPGKALKKWHGSLENNRGDRAALRKCASPVDVVFVPAYHALFQDMAEVGKAAVETGEISWTWPGLERRLRERLPAIAGLVALVKADEPRTKEEESAANPEEAEAETATTRRNFPKQMGSERTSGGGAVVSGLRFRRLLKCQTPEELYPMLRRTIRLLNNRADLYSLANDVLYWDEDVRKQWAYDYYSVAPQETD
ncbi:MAG: type I-E CRISPR-associated protein Cse2/CasB [Pseudomonadota bacterium]